MGRTLLLFFALPVFAQHASIDANVRMSDKPYLLATGEATVSANPDRAVIQIGVVTQGSTAAQVSAQNASQTDAVLADLRKLLASSSQLKTTGYSVRPNYQSPKPGTTPTITGYTATNVVEVTLDDLTLVGKVIDAALKSGANTIQNLRFGLKNPQTARSQALREASAQAKANAEAIAAGLGVHVARVLSAEEVVPEGAANFAYAKSVPLAAASVAPTQVEAGIIEVNVTVTLKVEVSE